MADTFTQLNVQAVFAVRGRQNLLRDEFRPELFKYMHGIIKGIGLHPLAVNGYYDHVHVFFELKSTMPVSKAVQEIKADSAKWINQRGLLKDSFHWQKGYGAFSYSRSQRDRVIKYIINQERHHSSQTFRREYLEFLAKFKVEYDEKYLFEFYE